jgi:hypothetical protein
MKRARIAPLLLLSTVLAACGGEPQRAPAGPGPAKPARQRFDAQPPRPDVEEVPEEPDFGPGAGEEPVAPRPVEFPRPEGDSPDVAALSAEESALHGTYRLREFIAMSGQVPGGDGRVNGTLMLHSQRRRATLLVSHGPLSNRHLGGEGTYHGGGRWRLVGDEVVLEPFVVKKDGKNEPLAGPWVARWKVVREGDLVLLKAGEFTYERAP